MTVYDIRRALLRRYHTHKYELCNSYIFNWESDFFSRSTSGYAYEVEIKVSRSDFFADFKKEKHQIFQNIIAGKELMVSRNGHWVRGDHIADSKEYSLDIRGFRRWPKNKTGVIVEDLATHQDYLNGYKDFYLKERMISLYAPVSNIKYIDLQKIMCPHRFYFAVPEGLIKKEEVPSYAGLIYISESGDKTIKEAQLIHKRSMDLNNILLDKFYWETKRMRPIVNYKQNQSSKNL